MDGKLFGDVHKFAIEVQICENGTTQSYGFLKIWINGSLIGDTGVCLYFQSVIDSFLGIVRRQGQRDTIPDIPRISEDFLNWVENIASFKNFFLPIEGFDDFLKLFFIDGDDAVFFFGLHPNSIGQIGYESYSSEVLSARVNICEIRNVIELLGKYVDELNKLPR